MLKYILKGVITVNERIITNGKINDFKIYLCDEERSKNTVDKYVRDVRMLKESLGGEVLHKADVLEYKQKLCETYSPASVNSMLSSINAFFLFMDWNDLKVKTLKIQRHIFADKSKELTKAEYIRLCRTAENSFRGRS